MLRAFRPRQAVAKIPATRSGVIYGEREFFEQKLAKAAKEGHIYASGEDARVSNQNKSCGSGVFRRCRLRALCELLFKPLHLGSGYAGIGRARSPLRGLMPGGTPASTKDPSPLQTHPAYPVHPCLNPSP